MTIIEAVPVAIPPAPPIAPCPTGYALASYERDECGRGSKFKWYVTACDTMRQVEREMDLHRELFDAIAFRVFQLPGDANEPR